jgi:nucleoside-diphosphate-sugar epimerase
MKDFRVLCATLLCFASFVGAFNSVGRMSSSRKMTTSMSSASKKCLLIGGTRFSGLYLWKELLDRGHQVTLFNRGKSSLKKLPKETAEEFEKRKASTRIINGNRQDAEDLKAKLSGESFDVIYDMNGREASDTAPLADIFNGKVEHFVYMSSAGVYKKSVQMPHIEGDTEDVKSRHKGKLETETYLKKIGIPFTSIRPTYIYGPMNYNPLEEYFFARHHAGRTVCIPGHGQHITGLGHVEDCKSILTYSFFLSICLPLRVQFLITLCSFFSGYGNGKYHRKRRCKGKNLQYSR